MKQAVELTRLTQQEREAVLRDLARNGCYPALVGDRVQGPGLLPCRISESPNRTLLIDGRAVATTGAKAAVDSSAHGCPVCPHPGLVVASGLPDVLINGRPIAVAGSETASGTGWVMEGRGETAGSKRQITQSQALGMRSKLVRGV